RILATPSGTLPASRIKPIALDTFPGGDSGHVSRPPDCGIDGRDDALALAALFLRRTRARTRPPHDRDRTGRAPGPFRSVRAARDVLAPDRCAAGAGRPRLRQAAERPQAVDLGVRGAHDAPRAGPPARSARHD